MNDQNKYTGMRRRCLRCKAKAILFEKYKPKPIPYVISASHRIKHGVGVIIITRLKDGYCMPRLINIFKMFGRLIDATQRCIETEDGFQRIAYIVFKNRKHAEFAVDTVARDLDEYLWLVSSKSPVSHQGEALKILALGLCYEMHEFIPLNELSSMAFEKAVQLTEERLWLATS